MWQDILLAFMNWILLAALIPTLIHKTQKPTFLTSVVTGACLSAIALAYATLEFWLAALPAGLMAGTWFLIAYQRYHLNRKGN